MPPQKSASELQAEVDALANDLAALWLNYDAIAALAADAWKRHNSPEWQLACNRRRQLRELIGATAHQLFTKRGELWKRVTDPKAPLLD